MYPSKRNASARIASDLRDSVSFRCTMEVGRCCGGNGTLLLVRTPCSASTSDFCENMPASKRVCA